MDLPTMSLMTIDGLFADSFSGVRNGEMKMDKIAQFDCTKCGACCQYYCDEDLADVGRRGRGIFVAGDDLSSLPQSLVVIAPLGSILQDGCLR
jgi:hypothetical protein